MNKILSAIRKVFAGVDPKALHIPITTAITLLVAKVGLSVDDPTVLAIITGAANLIVSALIPNAATGKADRWTPDGVPEPDTLVP